MVLYITTVLVVVLLSSSFAAEWWGQYRPVRVAPDTPVGERCTRRGAATTALLAYWTLKWWLRAWLVCMAVFPPLLQGGTAAWIWSALDGWWAAGDIIWLLLFFFVSRCRINMVVDGRSAGHCMACYYSSSFSRLGIRWMIGSGVIIWLLLFFFVSRCRMNMVLMDDLQGIVWLVIILLRFMVALDGWSAAGDIIWLLF